MPAGPTPMQTGERNGNSSSGSSCQEALENTNDENSGSNIGADPPAQGLLAVGGRFGPRCCQCKENNCEQKYRGEDHESCLEQEVFQCYPRGSLHVYLSGCLQCHGGESTMTPDVLTMTAKSGSRYEECPGRSLETPSNMGLQVDAAPTARLAARAVTDPERGGA